MVTGSVSFFQVNFSGFLEENPVNIQCGELRSELRFRPALWLFQQNPRVNLQSWKVPGRCFSCTAAVFLTLCDSQKCSLSACLWWNKLKLLLCCSCCQSSSSCWFHCWPAAQISSSLWTAATSITAIAPDPVECTPSIPSEPRLLSRYTDPYFL